MQCTYVSSGNPTRQILHEHMTFRTENIPTLVSYYVHVSVCHLAQSTQTQVLMEECCDHAALDGSYIYHRHCSIVERVNRQNPHGEDGEIHCERLHVEHGIGVGVAPVCRC